MTQKKKIAIVGGGIAGLTAAFFLNKKYDITLYEKQNRIGGNAYSYTTHDHQNLDIAVAAFGMAGYKNFYSLLEQLGIQTELCSNSYMSFHNLDNKDGVYFTASLMGLKNQRFDLLKPSRLALIARLFLGLKKAQTLSEKGCLKNLTLRQSFDLIPELSNEAQTILVCTLCLISSMSAPEVLKGPAEFFFKKLHVHHDIISPKAIYSVRCVSGGTNSYVKALSSTFKNKIVLNARVHSVDREDSKIRILFEDQNEQIFDHIVFACNADQALKLIKNPTLEEKNLLGVWKYKEGRVVVHQDHTYFPARHLIQAYTFLYTNTQYGLETSVNGALWHEPQVSSDCDYISSQHPNFPIKKELIEFETTLRTPIFDFNSYPTIKKLPSLNGTLGTYYCGSHFGFGLHDDAVSSALEVAHKLKCG